MVAAPPERRDSMPGLYVSWRSKGSPRLPPQAARAREERDEEMSERLTPEEIAAGLAACEHDRRWNMGGKARWCKACGSFWDPLAGSIGAGKWIETDRGSTLLPRALSEIVALREENEDLKTKILDLRKRDGVIFVKEVHDGK